MLDREVGDAAPRIEPIGRREGVGRAGALAGVAAAAARVRWRIGGQRQGGHQRAQQQPGAIAAADEIGVLALPAEPRGLRQRLLHDGRGIDEHLERGRRLPGGSLRDQPAGERFQRLLDDIMIILPLRIGGEPADGGCIGQRARIARRGIAHAEHHHRSHLRPQRGGACALVRALGHPQHVAMRPLGEPGVQPRAGFGRGIGRRDPARDEPQPGGFGLERGGEGGGVHRGPRLHRIAVRTAIH